ncbi:PepSY-like domain-containing protein [Adhaeribacter rhizoryzae]|uniref:Putative beta-lactamase-inhibitor-like PepSY-like domain-containing protein n=1 Tax=Adhaeribacter rhizoryzae TaxID=2607907 RepID=A0A5M6D2E9_9BACT|nr:PepSY-like domain-containing protein [Adhaeribacter rhizoryzae]KAA5541687.1 hypothetical protein F0145_20170 [Adhaeribacter rhizoryzae]
MRNKIFLGAGMLAVMFLFGCEKEQIISKNDLPQPAKDFISTHFAGVGIASVEKESDILEKTYDVILSNGTSLDFNEDGACTEIDGHTDKIPDSVVPTKILEYVQTNYAADFITSWEKDDSQQDIELASKLELKFGQESNFLQLEN